MNSESSDLKEVNIPLGARLLILDHIKRLASLATLTWVKDVNWIQPCSVVLSAGTIRDYKPQVKKFEAKNIT